MSYNPSTGFTQVLADNIWQANGIAVSHDETFVVVASTGSTRLYRYWLKGSKVTLSGACDIASVRAWLLRLCLAQAPLQAVLHAVVSFKLSASPNNAMHMAQHMCQSKCCILLGHARYTSTDQMHRVFCWGLSKNNKPCNNRPSHVHQRVSCCRIPCNTPLAVQHSSVRKAVHVIRSKPLIVPHCLSEQPVSRSLYGYAVQ